MVAIRLPRVRFPVGAAHYSFFLTAMTEANREATRSALLSMRASSLTVAPALGESPLCLRSAGVHWKTCNSTLMAVYSLLLQLAAALNAHHECRKNVAVKRAVAWCVLPWSGSVSEQFLACKGALDASFHDLDGGACSAAVAHVFWGKE